jgi:hypothetical protein
MVIAVCRFPALGIHRYGDGGFLRIALELDLGFSSKEAFSIAIFQQLQ